MYKFRKNESDLILYIYLFRALTVYLTNLFICWNNIEKKIINSKYIYFCDRGLLIPKEIEVIYDTIN